MPTYTIMNAFINDELINIICFIINYYNNDLIRNLWFMYIDYYNINSNVYILFITILTIFSLLFYSLIKIWYNSRFIYPYFQILLRLVKYFAY